MNIPIAKINIGTLWTMMSGLVLVVMYMFNTFATAADVAEKIGELEVAIAYGQYYDRLDDYDESIEEGNEDLAEEYSRQMERIKAIICEADPKWERCNRRL